MNYGCLSYKSYYKVALDLLLNCMYYNRSVKTDLSFVRGVGYEPAIPLGIPRTKRDCKVALKADTLLFLYLGEEGSDLAL